MTEGFDVPAIAWGLLIDRNEYNNAFFYHGSQGALAAVRWRNWKLYLNPSLQLYDLAEDPSESKRVLNQEITCKLRGMAILFQEEMRLDARPAGEAPPPPPPRGDGRTEVPAFTGESSSRGSPPVSRTREGGQSARAERERLPGSNRVLIKKLTGKQPETISRKATGSSSQRTSLALVFN
jgi:hypothetical protein